jgi:hypothetical protein
MRVNEKTRQKLSCAQSWEANAKYCISSKRWKINVNALEDYIDYMEGKPENFWNKS